HLFLSLGPRSPQDSTLSLHDALPISVGKDETVAGSLTVTGPTTLTGPSTLGQATLGPGTVIKGATIQDATFQTTVGGGTQSASEIGRAHLRTAVTVRSRMPSSA